MATKKKVPTKIELRKKAIEGCQDSKGRVTPDAVIEAAKDPKSILHGEFEWNVDKAAYKSWTETARRLIREVRLIVEYQDVRVVAPYYIADPGTDESSYIQTSKIANKHASAQRALADELARIKGAIQRATAMAAVFGLTSNFERMLDLAIETERAFSSNEIASSNQTELAPQ
jgi:hypothetical protein